MRRISICLSALLIAFGINLSVLPAKDNFAAVPVYGYKIVNVHPHDPEAFTQGLIFEDGFLYEGTGMYGESTLRKVELETGKVLEFRGLPANYFGEGITSWEKYLIQLTWRERKGFVYEKKGFRLIREFSYSGEGWGLTHDKRSLIMSDGSSKLYFLDPRTFQQIRKIEVHDHGVPVSNLNELEYVKGKIYANIWLTDRIAIISPKTGVVEAWIDLAGLRRTAGLPPRADVLNGIAYDNKGDRLFVTGKLWPKLFEIKIIP